MAQNFMLLVLQTKENVRVGMKLVTLVMVQVHYTLLYVVN